MHKKVILIAAFLLVVGVIGSVLTAKGYFSEAEGEMEQTEFSLDKVDDILIDTDVSSIELLPAKSDTILVESFYDKNQKPVSVKVKDGTLHIKENQKGAFHLGFNWKNTHVKIKIYLPKKQYGKITLTNDVGSTDLKRIESKRLAIKTSTGTVKLNQITADKLDVSSEVGTIIVKDSTGTMDLRSETGTIKVITKALKDNLDVTTEVGSIVIQTNQKPENIFITAYSEVGSTHILGEKTNNYKDGNAAHEVKLKTETGSIKVEQE